MSWRQFVTLNVSVFSLLSRRDRLLSSPSGFILFESALCVGEQCVRRQSRDSRHFRAITYDFQCSYGTLFISFPLQFDMK